MLKSVDGHVGTAELHDSPRRPSSPWQKSRCIRPALHSPWRGAGLQACDGTAKAVPHNLVLSQILPVFSLFSPCQEGASPVSVRRGTFTTGC